MIFCLKWRPPKGASGSVARFDDDFLLKLAEQQISNSVNTKVGAPASIRAQVAAAQTQEDKLKSIKKFYPDAIPVEVFDPEYGATKFGRGNFIITDPKNRRETSFLMRICVYLAYRFPVWAILLTLALK